MVVFVVVVRLSCSGVLEQHLGAHVIILENIKVHRVRARARIDQRALVYISCSTVSSPVWLFTAICPAFFLRGLSCYTYTFFLKILTKSNVCLFMRVCFFAL